MPTANELLNGALRVISSVAPGEGIDGAEADNALSVLNAMLAAWSAENLMPPFRTLEGFALTIGQASYTIGSGANFNTTRPDEITCAYYRDSAGRDTTLDGITKEQYNAIPLKSLQGDPLEYYYDLQYPNGVLYLYPVPSTALTLYLESLKPLNQFATLATSMTLPGEYQEAIKYLLAERLAPEYGFTITPDIRKLIEDARYRIMRKNLKRKVAGFDRALLGRTPFDIRTG